jgi:Arc/MetJ-type ribon-helix-helix transcriptional regulator
MTSHTPNGASVIKTVILTPEQRAQVFLYIDMGRYRSESEFIRIAVQNYATHLLKKATLTPESRRDKVEFSDGTTKQIIKKELKA